VIVTVGLEEVPAGKPLAVRVSETLTLAVCELDGSYYAFDGKCPHRGAALAEGEIAGELIVCPLHHFKFNLKTGRCVMPKHLRLRSYPVAREGDKLQIEIRGQSPNSDSRIKDEVEPGAADTVPAETPDRQG
jgi:nitrite reductase/ring-hydroxylating ferredoxin subunit